MKPSVQYAYERCMADLTGVNPDLKAAVDRCFLAHNVRQPTKEEWWQVKETAMVNLLQTIALQRLVVTERYEYTDDDKALVSCSIALKAIVSCLKTMIRRRQDQMTTGLPISDPDYTSLLYQRSATQLLLELIDATHPWTNRTPHGRQTEWSIPQLHTWDSLLLMHRQNVTGQVFASLEQLNLPATHWWAHKCPVFV